MAASPGSTRWMAMLLGTSSAAPRASMSGLTAKQFEPLRTGHQLEIALQPLVHARAVDDHAGPCVIAHLLQGERRAQHVLRELLSAYARRSRYGARRACSPT